MSSDISKCDQVVFECMQKVAEIVVQSRVLRKKGHIRDMNSKFYLHVEELEFVRHSMDAWKTDLHMPLGIDVFWQEHQRGEAAPMVELLERWEIVYEAHDCIGSRSAQLRHMCKRAIILLRTLYSFVRMVPAYQVHKRIQTAFDSTDRSPRADRDDMGFCLYPILDGCGGGSGLSFSTATSDNEDGGCRKELNTSIGRYSFKPLEAPDGSIKINVSYRRGVDPKARQELEGLSCQTSSGAPNMTMSIIQDYVPDEYANTSMGRNEAKCAPTSGGAVEGVKHGKHMKQQGHKLTTTPEHPTFQKEEVEYGRDGHGNVAMSGLGVALGEHNVNDQSGASQCRQDPVTDDSADSSGDADLGLGPGVLHWPFPGPGHGYADGRVYKIQGQGPAPFLTPGPHRHKLIPCGSQGHGDMEPLDLGPNAGVQVQDHRRPADPLLRSSGRSSFLADAEVNRHGANSRRPEHMLPKVPPADDARRAESRSLDTHGSLEAYMGSRGSVQSLPQGHSRPDHAPDTHVGAAAGPERRSSVPLRSVYRRNSISEAPTGAVAIMPHEQALLSVMKDDTNQPRPRRERTTTGQTGSTPPFSYCEKSSTARPAGANADESSFDLEQPLVSFSPPFDASSLSPGGHRQLPRPEDGVGHVSSMRTVHGQSGTEVTCRGAHTPLALAASCSPALLETLPKSPFSSTPGTRTSLEPSVLSDATGTNTRFSTSLALPMLERPLISAPGQSDRKMGTATQAAEVTEGLPFALLGEGDMEADNSDYPECRSSITRSVPPSTLFALCSAATSKSMFLAQEGLPPETRVPGPSFSLDGETHLEYADGVESGSPRPPNAAVRSLEEELDSFRQFHEELGSMRP